MHGPLTRYAKLRVAHALGISGTFPKPPQVSDPYMHHVHGARAVMHAAIANCRFHLKSVAGKTFPAFPAHAQPAILRIWQETHGDNKILVPYTWRINSKYYLHFALYTDSRWLHQWRWGNNADMYSISFVLLMYLFCFMIDYASHKLPEATISWTAHSPVVAGSFSICRNRDISLRTHMYLWNIREYTWQIGCKWCSTVAISFGNSIL